MNATWAETWERLGRANARAHRDRLRRLTLQEAYSRFEELCRTHTEIEAPPTRRTHAVGLARLWNRE